MPPIGMHSTGTTEEPWDGPAAVAASPNEAAVLRHMHAWRDPDGDPDAKASYKFPHHGPRQGSAANLPGVRNALARLPQANVPASDRDGIRRHLEAHLNAAGRAGEYPQGVHAMEVERRETVLTVELRAATEGKRIIGGYAAKFNRVSANLGGFVEMVAPTFFNKSHSDGWPGDAGQGVMARWNHQDSGLLGTTASGTLRLNVDETGLLYEVDVPRAREDLLELVQRGDVRKSSFAFRVPKDGDEWGLSDQGYPMRTLITGQLIDVAPVNIPAYVDSTAGLRSLAAAFDAPLDEVRTLADANELAKFFKRTDAPKRMLGVAAVLELQAKAE